MFSMRPEPDDYSIRIPVTFDYKGGRGENKRNKILLTAVVSIIAIIIMVGIATNEDNEIWKRCVIDAVIFIVVTTFLRFFVFKETVYSDIFESLKEVDFMPETSCFWQIYDINYDYPYICHYTNGLKGIFVRMEKDVIVGKSDTVMYDHFEGISEAYNMASSMNINMYHIDYMDNVGNDPRLRQMYDDLKDVDNPDMQDVLLDIFQNLQEEMSRDYSSFDTYVFFTKDKLENFVYNVQAICGAMLGGNFLSYKVLDVNGIRQSCMALFNLNEFSVINASESLLKISSHAGIVPISIENVVTGEYEKINKTVEEKRIEAEERLKQEQEAKEEAKRKGHEERHNKNKYKKKKKKEADINTESTNGGTTDSNNSIKDDEDLDLF